jgi:hypothetical protein
MLNVQSLHGRHWICCKLGDGRSRDDRHILELFLARKNNALPKILGKSSSKRTLANCAVYKSLQASLMVHSIVCITVWEDIGPDRWRREWATCTDHYGSGQGSMSKGKALFKLDTVGT